MARLIIGVGDDPWHIVEGVVYQHHQHSLPCENRFRSAGFAFSHRHIDDIFSRCHLVGATYVIPSHRGNCFGLDQGAEPDGGFMYTIPENGP